MATLQYVGARYVPKLFDDGQGGIEWRPNTYYEPITIVTYNNNSYTSRGPVAASVGNPAENGEYWARTGDYNADLVSIKERLSAVEQKTNYVTLSYYGAKDTGDMSVVVQQAVNDAASKGLKLVFDLDVSITGLNVTSYCNIDFNGHKITALPGGSGNFINIDINVSSISPADGMKKATFNNLWIDMRSATNDYALYAHGRNLYFDTVRIYDVPKNGIKLAKPDNYSTDGIYIGYLRVHGMSGSNIGVDVSVGDCYFDYTEVSGFSTCISVTRGSTTPGYAYDNMFGGVHVWSDGVGLEVEVDALSINTIILDSVSTGILLKSACKLHIGMIINTLVKNYIFSTEESGSYSGIVVDKISVFTLQNLCPNYLNFNGCLTGDVITGTITLSQNGVDYATLTCQRKGNIVSITCAGNANNSPSADLPALPPVFNPGRRVSCMLCPVSGTGLSNLGTLFLNVNYVQLRQAEAYLIGTITF